MARVDSLRQTSHWAEELGEDVAMGAVCGFQGLSLSEAAVEDKEGPLVKGRYAEEEVMVAPATERIKIKARAGLFKGAKPRDPVAVAGDAVEEAPAEGKRMVELTSDEVEWILAQEPHPFSPPDKEALLEIFPPEMIDRVMEAELRAAEAMAFVENNFFAFQDRVRKEFEEKRVVMVEDVSIACSEDNELDEGSDFGNYSNMYATDDEEVALESTSN